MQDTFCQQSSGFTPLALEAADQFPVLPQLPASWELVEALTGVAFRNHEANFALLVAFGFNCLLRTSEMLAITHRHVVFHQGNAVLSLVLLGSKTSQGNPQVLLVTDPSWFVWLDVFFGQTNAHVFRRLFTSYMGELGFQPQDYAPYCLRRGGATWHFQTTLSYDSTIARGRWSSVRAARQYIDEGTMQLAHVAWNRSRRRSIRRWQTYCRDFRLRQR